MNAIGVRFWLNEVHFLKEHYVVGRSLDGAIRDLTGRRIDKHQRVWQKYKFGDYQDITRGCEGFLEDIKT